MKMQHIRGGSRGSAAAHAAIRHITLQLDALGSAWRDISCKAVREEDQRTAPILFDSFPPLCDTVLRDPQQNIGFVLFSLSLYLSLFLLSSRSRTQDAFADVYSSGLPLHWRMGGKWVEWNGLSQAHLHTKVTQAQGC